MTTCEMVTMREEGSSLKRWSSADLEVSYANIEIFRNSRELQNSSQKDRKFVLMVFSLCDLSELLTIHFSLYVYVFWVDIGVTVAMVKVRGLKFVFLTYTSIFSFSRQKLLAFFGSLRRSKVLKLSKF